MSEGPPDFELLKKMAENRAKSYWLLSLFYLKRPDKKFLEELKENIFKLDIELSGEIKEGLSILKNVLIKEDDLNKFSERLAIEFTRLFRGIKEGYSPPPPYESVYRGEGRVMGKYTIIVMRKYLQHGFIVLDEYAGPQDYIGVELKFMSFLCYNEMKAWENNDQKNGKKYINKEREFLEEHIIQWIPNFCKIIERNSREEFYRGVAKLTREFLRTDLESIDLILKLLQ